VGAYIIHFINAVNVVVLVAARRWVVTLLKTIPCVCLYQRRARWCILLY
jgi:hypothetical protein